MNHILSSTQTSELMQCSPWAVGSGGCQSQPCLGIPCGISQDRTLGPTCSREARCCLAKVPGRALSTKVPRFSRSLELTNSCWPQHNSSSLVDRNWTCRQLHTPARVGTHGCPFPGSRKGLQQTRLRRARATVRTLDLGHLTAWRNTEDAGHNR